MERVKRISTLPDGMQESYKIYSTMNYGMFKFIDGNRDITHAGKIKKSIDAVGLLVCPVLVNEKFEIIDGQGRFTACKELRLPVYYVVQPGITIEHVRKMNSVASNWKVRDYVHSYTEGADKRGEYIYLESLQKQFPGFSFRILSRAAGQNSGSGHCEKSIREGDFACTQGEYEDAVRLLTWLQNFSDCVKEISGKSDYMYSALIYCYRNTDIDRDYLLKKFRQRYKSTPEVASIKGALESIEKMYNTHQDSKHEPVFLISDYERYMRAQNRAKRGQ